MSESDEKIKKCITRYSFSEFEKLQDYWKNKGIAVGFFISSIFTLFFMNIGDIECYSCAINLLVCLLFIFALLYRFYSYYISKKLTFDTFKEVDE